jgi:hypothetical protein
MEMVTTVATVRGVTEQRVVNDYTYRQAQHVGMTYLRDRMLVMEAINDALAGIGGEKEDDVQKTQKTSRKRSTKRKRGLPSWFSPRGKHVVVDLDGDMDLLKPYIGKRRGKKNG